MNINFLTYINLKHRQDRLNHIVNQLKSCKKIEHFKTEGVICNNYQEYDAVSYVKNNPLRHKGTIGCFLSNLQAIDNLIERLNNSNIEKNSYSIVMEDDVLINDKFWDFLSQIQPRKDFDFIFFASGRKLDPSKCLDVNHQLWPIYDDYPTFCGSFCYAIPYQKIKIIRQIINNITIYKDFDRFIFTHELLTSACYQTDLIKVDNNFSSDRDPTHSWKL